MYNPLLDLDVGSSIYCVGIESDLIVKEIIFKNDLYAWVKFQCHDNWNSVYRIEYCYYSLADGPHWLIDPVEYKLPDDYDMDLYWDVTNEIYSIAVYY